MKNLIRYQLLERKRIQLTKRQDLPVVVQDYLSEPVIKPNTCLDDIEFLVLDFETTGLDVDADRIVSLGYTIIKDLHIALPQSSHLIVNPKQAMNEQSVTIHELTDDEVQQGVSVSVMMEHLLPLMKGRVLVAHFDRIERCFINKAASQLYNIETLPFQMVDTLKIEAKKQQRTEGRLDANSLRLFNLISQYNLPRYKAHHALQDAISTAELLLAQIAHKGRKNCSKLSELL